MELLEYVELIVKYAALLINVIVYEYQLSTNLDYVVKLLTFINGKFCNEMLATCSLGRIDVIKEKMIN